MSKICGKCGRIEKETERIEFPEWVDLTEQWLSNIPTIVIAILPKSWRDKLPEGQPRIGEGMDTPHGRINRIIFADVEKPIITLRVY
jgi:hypothetical protein